ncbi:MAG: UDP-N-acetylmuramoyl-tripeptide--D-alanyl-D-alanine ligase [bacterium]
MDILKQLAKKIFQYEARLVLRKYKPKIIAITGSVGKTTTKEALYLVLSRKFFVRKSEKSFTTELGVPLTILGCPIGTGSFVQWIQNIFFGFKLLLFKHNYPSWLILEMDGDKPGDLRGVSSWLKIDILVITAIGEAPSHIEFFQNISHFLDEKRYLASAVARDGFVVFNADDIHSSVLAKETEIKQISCGVGGGIDVSGSEFRILYSNEKSGQHPTGMLFEISSQGEKSSVTIFGSLGIHNEYACLMAYAVAQRFGISHFDIISSLNQFRSLPGRMNIVAGIKNALVIDDSYNSSPASFAEAMNVFSRIDSRKRKIVVLGDMLELGKFSADEHKKIAGLIKDVAGIVYCVGIRAYITSNELLTLGYDSANIRCFDTATQAGKDLQNFVEEGDTVLVKGSQAMRLERVVEEIMRHPEDKTKLLVRQEPEWLERE